MTLKDLIKTDNDNNLDLACNLIQGMTKEQFMDHMHEWLMDYINCRRKLNFRHFPCTHSFYYMDDTARFESYYVEIDYSRYKGNYQTYYNATFYCVLSTMMFGEVQKTEIDFTLAISPTKCSFSKRWYGKDGTMPIVKQYFSMLSKALCHDAV